MDSLAGFVSYDGLVRDILSSRAIHVDEISWRAENVEWNQYELVVIRSPWDYQSAWDQFMGVLTQIDASTARLENCLSMARWNVEKTYLRDLREQGISIVPTTWMMSQPFVRSVTGYGEISLIFFAGQYSHSVLKKPKAGDFRVQEEHGGRIQSVVPEASIIEFAHRTLQAVPGETLYARVDLVFLDDGQPTVMEVELIEPSLYLSYDRQSPVRFADAIEALLGR